MKSIKRSLFGGIALWVISVFLPTTLPAAQNLFPTQVPTGTYQDYPNGVLGTSFQSDTPGRITALRYYAQAGDNDETTLILWDAATQTALASVTGTASGTAGWFELALPAPVRIAAGSNYVVSYNAGANGNYAVTAHFFDAPLVSGHLTVPIGAGVFADSGFPTTSFNNTCYFADVEFEPTAIYHLFTSQVPASSLQDYPNGVLGTRFQSSKDGQILALRYYAQAGDNDATTLKLWDAATQTELASVTGTPSGAAGWFELALPTPVNITAGTSYVVTYNAGANGDYVATSHFFDAPLVNGPLTTPTTAGVFADSGFPAGSFNNACYFADVTLETLLGSPSMAVEGNGLTIAAGDATPSTADGTQFGGVKLGSLQSRTFTITNSGTANLLLSGAPAIAIAGAQSGDFTLTTLPVSPVLPGSSATFTVQFAPAGSGLRDANVVITNNTGAPYQFAIEGIGMGSDYRLLGNRTTTRTVTIASDQIIGNRFMSLRNMRLSQINVRIASLTSLGGNALLKCAIYSDAGGGAGQLLGSTAEVTNPTNGWYTLALTQSVNVGVASNYWLVVWASADTVQIYGDAGGPLQWGSYPYDVTWPDPVDLTTGSSANTLCIYSEGIPTDDTGPEMEVQGGGIYIAAGGTNVTSANDTDFGGAMLYGGTRATTFTILNVGSGSLSLAGVPPVTVVGPQASDFSVTTQPAASVPSGGSSALVVSFTPSAAGLRNATVVIPHTDSSTAYQFAVQGTGLNPPGPAVIGLDGLGVDSRIGDAYNITGNRFMAPGDLRIMELRAKVVATAGSFTCAVYSDNNGMADRLLASSAPVFSPTNGWNSFALNSPLNVSGGSFYWLLIWSDTQSAALQCDPVGTAYIGSYPNLDLGGIWPAPIVLTPITAEARTVCIYAEGTPLASAPGPQMALNGNGKLIVFGDTSPSDLDGTDFGALALGAGSLDHTFTIQNSGSTQLQLTGTPGVSISGPQARDFQVTSPPASPVAPGASTSFTVRFAPSAVGLRSATLSITNNDIDPNKNPYQFAVRGAGLRVGQESLFPDSKVGSDVDNDGTIYALGTVFQCSVPGAITQLRVFSVAGDYGDHTAYIWRNLDNTAVGGPYTWNFGGVKGWVYFDIPPVNIDPATDYTVSISTGTGPMRDYANIAADVGAGGNNGLHLSYPPDAGVFLENLVDSLPYKTWNSSSYLRDIIFVPATNTILFPVMAVTGNGNLIPDGYSSPSADNNTDFGHVPLGAAPGERTFVIANSGAAALHLIGTPRIAIAGTNASDFTVVTQPAAASVSPAGSVPFTIRFSPSAAGVRKALVAIENDDKNAYYFTISGTGDVEFRITSIAPDLGAGNVTLQWQGPDAQFQVERAFSASGPFAAIGSLQTSKSYTDLGILQTNAGAFYRIRY